MEKSILRVEGINKCFGVTHANKNITLEIERGCIHGLAGENGSGKSTLSSIICGIQKADSGRIYKYKDDKEYHVTNPSVINKDRIAMVVQEMGIVESLSPAMNIFLGRAGQFATAGIVNIKKINTEAKELMKKWELSEIPLDGRAGELSIEQRKIIELARALSTDPDFLILDEISQALSFDNRKILYRFMERFVSEGKTILMITHDLEEMMRVCNTISVLRDGELITTKSTKKMNLNELKHLMIGREISEDYYRLDNKEQFDDEIILEVKNLSVLGKIKNVSFDLHKGEILGICGLSDAGIHTVGRAIYGIDGKREGNVCFKLENRQLVCPKDMIQIGGAYLSKDRDHDGLMLNASIADNISLPSDADISSAFAFLNPRKVSELAQKTMEAFEVKTTGNEQVVRSLSGGNKQKVNLSRWLIKDLKFIILDCPTRGVDIGVKAYIYDLLKKAKANGLGIIMISDEIQEAIGMADRIMAMRDGEVVDMLNRSTDFNEEKIIEVML